MSQRSSSGNFFKASQIIINDGSFTMQNITHNSSGPKGGYERLLDAVAPNALHDSGHVVDPPKCHPGTRVAIIQTIVDWIAGSNEANRNKLLTWLSGAAGAGKSAIGRSVCERCAEEGTLLASFFFGSRDPTRNHPKLFPATIAYQICKLNPRICDAVSAAVDHDPLVFTQSLQAQLMSLVLGPLSATYANEPSLAPRLIVMDGLDECLDKASQQDVLNALFHLATTSVIPIRILVCSRQESQIVTMFSATKMSIVLFKILLDNDYSSWEDIELYLREGFQEIRETHIFKPSIPSSWPTESQLNTITCKSFGQFIYAAIVLRYLKSSCRRPQQRLDALLGLRPPFKDLPFSEIDALYLHLLNRVDNPSLAADILAFLTLADTMCTADIDRILTLESGETEVILFQLSAIVDLEPMVGSTSMSRASLLHKSFEDFLFDSDRSKELSRTRMETYAWHSLRIIEIFSEKCDSCRLQYRNYNIPYLLTNLGKESVAYRSWSSPTQLALRNAIIHFPMSLYCKELSSHSHLTCGDHKFLCLFFPLLIQLEREHVITSELLLRHACDFWNYALLELTSKYKDHWHMNLIFTAAHIKRCIQHAPQIFDSFSWVIQKLRLSFNFLVDTQSSFKLLPSKSDEALIISKGAMHCLQHVCNPLPTRRMARSFLEIRQIDQNRRKTYPWQWHRRSLSGDRGRSLYVVAIGHWDFKRKPTLKTFTRRDYEEHTFGFDIYSLRSLWWTDWMSKSYIQKTQSWREYLNFLEYLVAILPHAARFPPLIHLCKTKAFAPASMMFPDTSRCARRAIHAYLERVDRDNDATNRD